MTTINIKTIGATGDYATIAAWETATQADLVSGDLIEIGEIIDSGTITEYPVFAGATTGPRNYRWLRARDHVSWNHADSTGVHIDGHIDASGEDYVRISGFKIQSADPSAANHVEFADGGCIHSCVVDTSGQTATGGVAIFGVNDLTVHGCLVIGAEGVSGAAAGISATSATVVHTTVFGIDDSGGTGNGITAGATSYNTGVANSGTADFVTPVGSHLVSTDPSVGAIAASTASIAPGDYWRDIATGDFRPVIAGPLENNAGPYTPQPRPDGIATLVADHPLNERLEVCNPWTGVDTPDGRLDESWSYSPTSYAENRGALGLVIENDATNRDYRATTANWVGGRHFTVSVWAKSDSAVQKAMITQWLSSGATAPYASLYLNAGGQIKWRILTGAGDLAGGGQINHTPAVSLHDSRWHHYMVRGNGASVKMFLDGAEVESVVRTDFSDQLYNRTIIGSQGNANLSAWQTGSIADVRVWSRALTDTEVSDLYKKPWDQYEQSTITKDANNMSMVTATGAALGGITNPAIDTINLRLQNENATALGTYTPITVQIPWLENNLTDGEGVFTLGSGAGAQTGTFVLGARAGKRKRMAHLRGCWVPPQSSTQTQGQVFSGTLTDGAAAPPKFTTPGEGIAMVGGDTPDTDQIQFRLRGMGSGTDAVARGWDYDSTMSLSRFEQIEDTPGRQVWLCDQFHTLTMREDSEIEALISGLPVALEPRPKPITFSYKMHIKLWMYFYPSLNQYRFSAWVGYDDMIGERWRIPRFPNVELSVPDTWGIYVKNNEAKGGTPATTSGGRRRIVVNSFTQPNVQTGFGFMVTGSVISPSAPAAELAEWTAQLNDRTVWAQVKPDEILGHVEGIWDFQPKLHAQYLGTNGEQTETGQRALRNARSNYFRAIYNKYVTSTDATPWSLSGLSLDPWPIGGGEKPGMVKLHELGFILGPNDGSPLEAELAIWAAYDFSSTGSVFHWADTDGTSARRYKKLAYNDEPGLAVKRERLEDTRGSSATTPYDFGKAYQSTSGTRYSIPANRYENSNGCKASGLFGLFDLGSGPYVNPIQGPNPEHQIYPSSVLAWFFTSDYIYQEQMEQSCENYRLENHTGTTTVNTRLGEARAIRYERRIITILDNLTNRVFADTIALHVRERFAPTTRAYAYMWAAINDVGQDIAFPALNRDSSRNFQQYKYPLANNTGGYFESWFGKFGVPIIWRIATYFNDDDIWTFAYEYAKAYATISLSQDTPNSPPRRISFWSLPGYCRNAEGATAAGSQGDFPPAAWATTANRGIYHWTDNRDSDQNFAEQTAAYRIFLQEYRRNVQAEDLARAQTAATFALNILAYETPENDTRIGKYMNMRQDYELTAAKLINRYSTNGGGGGGSDPVNFEGLSVQGNSRVSVGQFATAGAPVTFAGGQVQGVSVVRTGQLSGVITKQGRASMSSFNLPVIF